MSEYIERDALLKELATHFNKVDGKTLYHPSMALAMHDVRNLPAADVAPVVHARWEDRPEIKSFKHTNIPVVQCSECKIYFCDIINNHRYMYHYCPNCGAKMDGE